KTATAAVVSAVAETYAATAEKYAATAEKYVVTVENNAATAEKYANQLLYLLLQHRNPNYTAMATVNEAELAEMVVVTIKKEGNPSYLDVFADQEGVLAENEAASSPKQYDDTLEAKEASQVDGGDSSQGQSESGPNVSRSHRGGALPRLLPRWFDRFYVRSFSRPFSSTYGFQICLTNARIGHLSAGNLTGCNIDDFFLHIQPVMKLWPRFLRQSGIFDHLPPKLLNEEWIYERKKGLPKNDTLAAYSPYSLAFIEHLITSSSMNLMNDNIIERMRWRWVVGVVDKELVT
ncbi:hypothetical protein HAX54_031683, partial [Datura stramonium]|nr:hypothetical protein [Datura stramonium]